MRITGGSAKGRKLTPPRSNLIRPTCDRVREALFNIIGERIVGSRVLDLFAGTGAIGIECLSRGAASVLFVDQSIEAGRLIETNLRACISQPKAAFVALNLATVTHLQTLRSYASAHGFNLIVMDPPYQKNLAQRVLAMVETAGILADDALIVVEEQRQVALPARFGKLTLFDQRRYGETGLWLYAPRPAREHTHD